MSINYLILYTPNHSLPVGLVEFHTSIGNTKVRNLKWHKDLLKISSSNKLSTDLRYLRIYGYVSRVKDLAKLPRTTQRNIAPEYRPIKVTNEELIGYLVDQKLSKSGRDF
jgi:hypothetical protein